MLNGNTPKLIAPYGGKLVNLLVPPDDLEERKAYASRLRSLQLSNRSVCDLELLTVGGFSPLDRFMGQADYQRVVHEMRLADGHLFPIPVTLPIAEDADIFVGEEIALRNDKNELLAIMTVEEKYAWDHEEAALKVFGSLDPRHPLVAEMNRWGKLNISGRLQVLHLPTHYDFLPLRLTPAQVRERLETYGHANVVAFQTRNPLHRVHEELTKRAIAEVDGVLLLHPVGRHDQAGRRGSLHARPHLQGADRELLRSRPRAALAAAAGDAHGRTREALWHAIIRRNYGANHLIVGRDHAGPGNDSTGKPFYGPYDAQDLVQQHQEELGVKAMPFHELLYLTEEGRYEEVSKIPAGTPTSKSPARRCAKSFSIKGVCCPTGSPAPKSRASSAKATRHVIIRVSASGSRA